MQRAGQNRAKAHDPDAPVGESEPLVAALRAAAEPLRLSVLRLLERDAFAVQELCRMLDVSQPALSHHLKLLAAAGLVAAHRDGTSTFYRRALLDAEHPAQPTVAALLSTLDARPLPERARDAVCWLFSPYL